MENKNRRRVKNGGEFLTKCTHPLRDNYTTLTIELHSQAFKPKCMYFSKVFT